jgi:hypothetical protein
VSPDLTVWVVALLDPPLEEPPLDDDPLEDELPDESDPPEIVSFCPGRISALEFSELALMIEDTVTP